MPELPEVETIVNALEQALNGKSFAAIETFIAALRYPLTLQNESLLLNHTIIAVRRRARYIIIELDNRQAIVIHLGMSGSIRIVPPDCPRKKHEHVLFYINDGLTMRFDCPRRFGFVKSCLLSQTGGQPPFLSELGPEPLANSFNADYFYRKSVKSRGAVKNLLMNNRIVVGVGNIYASEALFMARINPAREGCRMDKDDCKRLTAAVKKVLNQAIQAGGTTFSDYRQVDGSEGKFVQQLQVYGRGGLPCLLCGTTIATIKLGGRSSAFCPPCQT